MKDIPVVLYDYNYHYNFIPMLQMSSPIVKRNN